MNNGPKHIQLSVVNGQYVAKYVNDPETVRLFETDTLPTPYSASVPACEVVDAIGRMNPKHVVSFI